MLQEKLRQPVPVKTHTVVLGGKTNDRIDLWVDSASNQVKTMRKGVYGKDIQDLLSDPNVQVVAQYG